MAGSLSGPNKVKDVYTKLVFYDDISGKFKRDNGTTDVIQKDLLTVVGGTVNEGLTESVKRVFDGDGVGSPLWIGKNSLQVAGDLTVTVAGKLNLADKSSEPSSPNLGDISMINGSLYVAI